jgi:hypothetical protein
MNRYRELERAADRQDEVREAIEKKKARTEVARKIWKERELSRKYAPLCTARGRNQRTRFYTGYSKELRETLRKDK